jgi:hypothetical protein
MSAFPTPSTTQKSQPLQANAEHHTMAAESCSKASSEHTQAAKACAAGDRMKADEHAKKADDHSQAAQDYSKKAMAA